MLFPTEEARRRAILSLARVAGGSLTHFCVVDDHVHLVVAGSRERAANLCRGLSLAFRRFASGPTALPRHRDVCERRHLVTLVDYVLGQPARHGLPGDPALWTGSAFLDLIGARHLPGLRLRLRDLLPRLTRGRLQAAVGLAGADLRPLPPGRVRQMGAFALLGPAAAAFAAPAGLRGNVPPARAARLAVVGVSQAAGIPRSEVAAALGILPRSLRRLAARPAPPRLLDTLRTRLVLEVCARRAIRDR